LAKADWDAVVTDVESLHADPLGIVRRCANATGATPVIALAGPNTLHAAEASRRAGATEVLRKAHLTPALVAHLLRWATEKKRLERELYQREEWLQSVTARVSDGLFRCTPNGGIVYADTSLVDLLGYESEEALSRAPPETVLADPAEWDRLLHALRDQGQVHEKPLSFRNAADSLVPTLVSCTRILGKEDVMEYLDGVVTRLPERPGPENLLQAYTDALDHSYSPAFILEMRAGKTDKEPTPVIVYANEAFGLASGHEPPSLQNQPLRVLHDTDAEVHDRLRSALAEGVPWNEHVTTVRADGSTIPADWFFAPIRNATGTIVYWLCVQHASAERHELARTTEETQVLSDDSPRLKAAVLRNLSHELRTPLTSINGFAQILKEELSAPHDDLVDHIQSNSRRLQETIDSVLRLSRLDATDSPLDRTSVELRSVVQTVIERLRPKIEEESVSVAFTPPSEPVRACTNRGAVDRIVTNLLENALKFTPAGGTVELSVQPSDTNNETRATIVVEDTGIGIGEDVLPTLFEPFTQESQGLTREYGGTGLGLAVVKRLLDLLSGRIDVATEKGTGSRFTVQLPGDET
jgi:PAS domain S-box-containing protein